MYQSKNLSVLSYANGFTLWHYTTEDAAGDVDTQGYFNNAADMLRAGDIIVANVETADTAPAAGMFHVNSVTPGAADVNNMVPLSKANAD